MVGGLEGEDGKFNPVLVLILFDKNAVRVIVLY